MRLFATSFLNATVGVVLALSAVTSFAADAAKPEPAKAAKAKTTPTVALKKEVANSFMSGDALMVVANS